MSAVKISPNQKGGVEPTSKVRIAVSNVSKLENG